MLGVRVPRRWLQSTRVGRLLLVTGFCLATSLLATSTASASATPSASASATTTRITITFDTGRLKLSGFTESFPLVDAARPVQVRADVRPNGRFTVTRANFRFPAHTVNGVLSGLSVTTTLAPLANVTGRYDRRTGRLATDWGAYRLRLDTRGILTASCTVSPVALAFSTETRQPFRGDRFNAGLPPVNGVIVAAWRGLPPSDNCRAVDSFITGAGGIQLGSSPCQAAKVKEASALALYRALVRRHASRTAIARARTRYLSARRQRQRTCGQPVTQPPSGTSPPASNHPPAFPSPVSANSSTHFQYDSAGRLVGATTTINVLTPASDPDGDSVTYSWGATNGSIVGNGLSATWTRVIEFGRPKAGNAVITASDGRGGTDTFTFIFR